MRLSRRECVGGLATFFVSGCRVGSGARWDRLDAQSSPAAAATTPPKKGGSSETHLKEFTPEMFGAVGDGVTNDSAAFAEMSIAVNAGGGTVTLQKTTYIVGGNVPDPTGIYAYGPATIMDFNGCTRDLIIQGNNARLLCATGLRYGTFDPVTGAPTQNSMPFYGSQQRATPYDAMISISNCKGRVGIKELELDGNVDKLTLGGGYGDTGWQIPASGLRLLNNVGGEFVVGVYSHHHAQDGLYLDGMPGRTASTQISEFTSEYNGRQGCSIVGGCNYSFTNSSFRHTGRGAVNSAPGAGVDIEAEVQSIRNVSFLRCEFSDNSGAGMVADSGDTDGATFTDCLFVGTTNWSAWPRKPHFYFSACRFVGALVNAYGDVDPERAARFDNCIFCDDPALSPTGEVYKVQAPIADLSDNLNVQFNQCEFTLKHEAVLPWSVNAIYSDSTMSQSASAQAYPRGTFKGTNRINGNVDLYGSTVLGPLTVNGQLLPLTG